MDTLTPAVAVAVDALRDADREFAPVGVIDRGGVVAVLVEGSMSRTMVFVQHRDDAWITLGSIVGSYRVDRPRATRTPDRMALSKMATKSATDPDGVGWYAVTGLAAEDAESVTLTSELDQHTAPIDRRGRAFAVVRARPGERPTVTVRTRDGRTVSAGVARA
ncbi:hypothetical protein ACWDSJ_36270 [Nocardia sp. NPDC003482]